MYMCVCVYEQTFPHPITEQYPDKSINNTTHKRVVLLCVRACVRGRI